MRLSSRYVLASMLVASLATGAVHAQTAFATGFGQSWPNVTDVSTNANYHVYVFDRAGTRYIQVNDAAGNVRGAFARTAYSLTGLPVGSDAARLATPSEPLPVPASTAGVIVYDDGSVRIFVAPQSDGTAALRAAGGDCKTDPTECSSHGP